MAQSTPLNVARTRRRRRETAIHASFLLLVVLCMCPSVSSFSVTMMNSHRSSTAASNAKDNYKPPVQTSVRQLQNKQSRSSDHKYRAYAGTAAPSSTSFEERMRQLVVQQKRPTRTTTQQRRPSNVKDVSTLQEYKEAIVGNPKLVVVRFHASYCRACRAVAPHLYKLASHNPGVDFIDVAVTERNAALHQGLGVVKLPTVHVYHPTAGLVEDLPKLTRPHVPMLRDTLQTYVQGYCSVAYDGSGAVVQDKYS